LFYHQHLWYIDEVLDKRVAKALIVPNDDLVSLRDYIRNDGRTPADCFEIVLAIATSLQRLHNAGFVHCNLNIDNIFVAGGPAEVVLHGLDRVRESVHKRDRDADVRSLFALFPQLNEKQVGETKLYSLLDRFLTFSGLPALDHLIDEMKTLVEEASESSEAAPRLHDSSE
jgi:tRNA A-37 threonylcarbamoyl transferase component Bud32